VHWDDGNDGNGAVGVPAGLGGFADLNMRDGGPVGWCFDGRIDQLQLQSDAGVGHSDCTGGFISSWLAAPRTV
jgi:hypothetical protein